MATGRDLPEMCRDTFPRPVSRLMWVQAELVAIATDLAEVIGGAIALNLLFGIPLFTGGVITGIVAFALLALQHRGYRPFELAIAGLLGVILLGFLTHRAADRVPGRPLAEGLVPRFDGTESLLLATGILGATVMPHVIYLHSALTKRAHPAAHRRATGASCCAASSSTSCSRMGLAGLVNASMLIIAATLFFGSDVPDTDTLEGVYAGLGRGARPARRARVRAGAAGLGLRVLRRGHLRGSGRDAGLHPARSIPLLLRRR